MENQRKTITFGPVGKYDNLNPQVEPVRCKYADMVAMRDEGKLIPGQLYRITDYVTTVNEFMEPNARSAGHQFDIIVLALDATTLSEDAMAARHDGDEYFAKSRLEAWELKYRLDNVQWSARKGKYYIDSNGYVFYDLNETIELDGTAYHLLQGLGAYVEDWADYAVVLDFQQGSNVYAYYDDGEFSDEDVGNLAYVDEVTSDGTGTITYLKDEFNNECPYDFKNVQFKRYITTDSVNNREGLDGMYMVADPENCPIGLSVDDTNDFIWAYTFSSDNFGGEQEDYSLTEKHVVHDNKIKQNGIFLNNIVTFGERCYCLSFGNECYNISFGDSCNSMSFGNKNGDMSFGKSCRQMVFGESCSGMSLGQNNVGISCKLGCYNIAFTQDDSYVSFGMSCHNISIGESCENISFGNDCMEISVASQCARANIENGVKYIDIADSTWNFHILCGFAGSGASSHTALAFAIQTSYTQIASKNSSNEPVIYVPGDLVQ